VDPLRNPYTPNAGARPAVLAGREEEEQGFDLLIRRLSLGFSEKSLLVTGLRGVGKTVLLGEFGRIADKNQWVSVDHEVTSGTDLRQVMARLSRTALFRISPSDHWKARAKSAAAILRSFTLTGNPDGSATLAWGGISAEPGVADSGDLDADLTAAIISLGEAAQEHGKGVVFLFDEVQFMSKQDLTALVLAFHKSIQRNLPITLVAAGLPQLPTLVGQARSYAERLFSFPVIGSLRHDAALAAVSGPAESVGVAYEAKAVEAVVEYTEGYPYFIQEMGSVVWDVADVSPITVADVKNAVGPLESRLDNNFFKARVARTTALELQYLRAMAELASGPKASGDIATTLGYGGSANVGTTRANLINKGLIYTPGQGLADFTVPQFDRYMKRTFPFEARVPGSKRGRAKR
jgi:hypothetical protein